MKKCTLLLLIVFLALDVSAQGRLGVQGKTIKTSGGGGGGGGGTPTVTWTQQTKTGTWPDHYGYSVSNYSSLLQGTLYYGVMVSTTIYGSDILLYNSTTHTFSRHPNGNNTQSSTTSCLHSAGPTYTGYERSVAVDGYVWPTDRHAEQMVTDNTNNLLWVFAGVCANYYDDVAGSTDRIWKLTLNSTFANSTWSKSTITVRPPTGMNTGARLAYSSTDNFLLLQGGSGVAKTYVYCSTANNPTPGTLTSAQIAVGCTTADDFTEISPVGGVYPTGEAYGTLYYVASINKFLWFGGQEGACSDNNTCAYSQTWSYTPSTKTWANITPASQPLMQIGIYVNQPSMAYDRVNGKIWYRLICTTGTCTAAAPKDYVYDVATNVYTEATTLCAPSCSGGPLNDSQNYNALMMSFDEGTSKIIAASYNPGTNKPFNVWEGTVSY